jgi:hypothetical protein
MPPMAAVLNPAKPRNHFMAILSIPDMGRPGRVGGAGGGADRHKRSVNRAENWHQLHLEVLGHGHKAACDSGKQDEDRA